MYGHRLWARPWGSSMQSFSLLARPEWTESCPPVVISTPPGIFLEFPKILLFYSISFQHFLYLRLVSSQHRSSMVLWSKEEVSGLICLFKRGGSWWTFLPVRMTAFCFAEIATEHSILCASLQTQATQWAVGDVLWCSWLEWRPFWCCWSTNRGNWLES